MAKIFEVGDVLPATTQLRVSWTPSLSILDFVDASNQAVKMNDTFSGWAQDHTAGSLPSSYFIGYTNHGGFGYGQIHNVSIAGSLPDEGNIWWPPYSTQKYIDIDSTVLSKKQRTVLEVNSVHFFYEAFGTIIPDPEPTTYPNTKEVAFRGDGTKFNRINGYKAIGGVWHRMSGISDVSYDITQVGSVLQIDDAPATQDGSVLTIE